MEDIPALQEQWERDWRGPSDALRLVQKHAKGTLAAGSASRVSVLDAGVLDEQVENLLLENLKKVLLSNVKNPALVVSLTPELLLAVRTLVWMVTVGRHGTSYGMDLQNIAVSRLAKTSIKVFHYALSVLAPYAWTRFSRYIAQHGWWRSPSEEDNAPESTGIDAWKHKAWQVVQTVDKAYTVASVANFALFLWNGRYPTVTSRVLRTGVPVQRNPGMRRTILYGQMKRQLFWEGLTETTLLVMPMLLTPSVRRSVNTVVRSVTSALGFSSSGPARMKRDGNIEANACALCGESPARTAYISSDDSPNKCCHVFCYLCAYRELNQSSKHIFECPICHAKVTSISRASSDSVNDSN